MNLLYQSFGKFDHRLKIVLTNKCNFRCSYCFVHCKEKVFKERTADEWASAINRIGRKVVLSGGEPTLYSDLYKLLSLINPSIGVSLYTNLSVNPTTFIQRIHRDVSLFVSYHKEFESVDSFLKKAVQISKEKKFTTNFHMVRKQSEKAQASKIRKDFKKKGISLVFLDEFSEIYPKLMRERVVFCYKRTLNIAPDGTRYACLAHMSLGKRPLVNIIDTNTKLEESFIGTRCGYFGKCEFCDLLGETLIVKGF